MRYLFTLLLSLLLVGSSLYAQEKEVKLEKGLYAKIITSKGDILIHLLPEKAPLTVANFVGLAAGDLTVFDTIEINKPFYDGLVFHRVVPDFVIQGGDPTGTGSGGPGYQFWNETDTAVKHKKGAISMANSGPNTNGSQFFITKRNTPHLNGSYNAFGYVIQGQDVVDKIRKGDTMQKVKIIEKGLKYKWFYNPTKEFKKAYEKLAQKHEKRRLKNAKINALKKARFAEAQGATKEEYKTYFYNLIKEKEPEAKQTESGLVYVVRKKGHGDSPEKGDKVSLHYLGTLLLGKKFDSSYDRNKPLTFNYLITNLIPGFNEGVGLSKEGEEIDLFIPYFLGYGERGRPPQIPPYADLIFSLKILKVESK